MASIYESPGQQVELTGFQSTSSTPLVQAYDPSGIMLQQSEKDLEALAKFSGTLGGILKKKGEEIKEETIGKGFTKFITGEIVFNPDTGEFNAKEEAVRTGARNATAIAEAAEGMPGEQGMSAQIRRTSPAIRGLEAMGASRAMAQNAPISYTTFVQTAKNEGRVLIDPDTKAPIQLGPQMTRVEWERAERILLGQWGQQTGYNRINPQVMMQYGAPNLAIARARLNEEFGAELDASAKFEARQRNKQTNLTAFASINSNDPSSAARALATIEQSSATSNAKQRNEDFIEDVTDAVNTFKSNKDIAGATSLLNLIETVPHPSKVGTYGSRFRQTIQTLREGLQDAGVAIEGVVLKEREAQFIKEAENANRFPQVKRDELLNGKDGIIPRARAAGISEKVITEMLTGGSSVTEQALLEGSRNDPNYFNKLNITKITIDQLEASNIIDKTVADQLRGDSNLKPGTDTVEARVKAASPLVETALIADMGGSFVAPGQPMTAAGADAKFTRESAMLRAAEALAPEIQAQIKANIPLNVQTLRDKLIAQARSYLFNSKDQDYFNTSTKTAPNRDRQTQGVSITTTFTTNQTKDQVKAIVDNIGGGVPQTPIGSFQLGSTDISNAQEAVNTGGKIPQYILNIAKSEGFTDINKYMREQAVKAGAPEWKPNQGQEAFLQEVRRVSPAYATRFADPNLTPTERRNLLNQYRTLQSNIQIQADQSAVPAGTSLSVLQQAIVQKESGGDYGQYNFGVARSGPGNPAITTLKAKDVIRGDFAINGQTVRHFGAYQFKPTTFAAVIKAAGISPDQPFNQATQDKAFQAVVVGGALPWRTKLNDYMAGKVPDTTANLAAAVADMSTEWEGSLGIPPLKLGQMLRNIRLEQTSVVDPKLSTLPGPTRTVEVGKTLLARGIKIWQHPNFDLVKDFVSGSARVGSHSSKSFHNTNQALDLPLSHNTVTKLDATYDYLLKNAKALGISEIYWDRKGYYRDGQMIGGPRSKAIPDHADHLHVSFN
jgi:hypothetical protein